MKIMYKAFYTTGNEYTDDTHELTAFLPTLGEAEEAVKAVKHEGGYGMTGDWWINKYTMDEEAFTYTEEGAAHFNWYNEIGRFEHYKEMIAIFMKDLEQAKNIKPKTERGEKVKQGKIDWIEKRIKEYTNLLNERA